MNIFKKIVIYLQTAYKQKRGNICLIVELLWVILLAQLNTDLYPLIDNMHFTVWQMKDCSLGSHIVGMEKTYSLLLPIHSQCKIISFSTFPQQDIMQNRIKFNFIPTHPLKKILAVKKRFFIQFSHCSFPHGLNHRI